MTPHPRLLHLRIAIVAALLGALLLGSTALAQPATNAAGLVDVASPPSTYPVSGNVTFTGVAVDTSTGLPANRVAVYDGDPGQGIYLADVSMDTVVDLATVYPGGVGTAQAGWTLIFDSNRLAEGAHTLTFVGQFQNGTITPTTHALTVDNIYQANSTSNGAVIWYNGGYWINGIYVGDSLESIYYDPITGGYWVNGVYMGPSYQWQSSYYYPTGGYWIGGTYYDPYNGTACTGGTCYYVAGGD